MGVKLMWQTYCSNKNKEGNRCNNYKKAKKWDSMAFILRVNVGTIN